MKHFDKEYKLLHGSLLGLMMMVLIGFYLLNRQLKDGITESSVTPSNTAVQTAVSMVKKWESFSSTIYKCQARVKTVGYGFTQKKYLDMAPMSKSIASSILTSEIRKINQKLKKNGVDLPANKQAVLIDFVWNCGWSAFQTSTLKRKIQKDSPTSEIIFELRRWKYVTQNGKKQVSKGLVNRCEDRVRIWTKREG